MSRYIDADNAMFRMQCCGTYHGVIAVDTVESIIKDAPTIDIVRCKECKHWRAYETWSECERWTGDPYDTAKTNADDFCSYGEREGE